MSENLSIASFEKSGFAPIKNTHDYTILKSEKGIVLAHSDGEFEGFLKGKLQENILTEGFGKMLVGLILIVGLGTTYFTTDITIVTGKSMEPTYRTGNVIIQSKLPNDINRMLVSRNSIVKFKSPEGDTMIKRVIAVEGDEVEYRGASLFVNGKFVGENNVWAKQQLDKSLGKKDKLKIIYEPFSFKLKNGEYYVVGDNQDFSIDSRNFGPISSDCVISVIKK